MPISRRTSLKLTAMGLAGLPLLAATHRAEAATHKVVIEGFAFKPDVLQVGPGDTVLFENRDGAPHTATARNGAFDTGPIAPGDTGQITVPGEGDFEYFCEIHPSMVAVIVT